MRFHSGGSNILLLSRSFEKWSIKGKLLNGTTGRVNVPCPSTLSAMSRIPRES